MKKIERFFENIMIQEFSVKNFYSIREQQTISFVPTNDMHMHDQYVHTVAEGVELLKLGIIYGSNASGKTTLLNALTFFRHLMLMKPESKKAGLEFYPFMLDTHSRTERSLMRMVFWLNGERYIMHVEFDPMRIYEETLQVYTSNRPTTLYKRTYQPETDHSVVSFGQKVGIDKGAQRAIEGNTTNNCTVMAAIGQSNIQSSKLNDVYNFFYAGLQMKLSPRDPLTYNVVDELLDDVDGRKKDFFLGILKASDFNIVDLQLVQDETPITPELEMVIRSSPMPEEARAEMLSRGTIKNDYIAFQHTGEGGEYVLREQMESAGTKRFLGMATVLYYVLHEDNFIPIDEVETSLHYELLSYFIKLFLANSEGSSQLLLTTHDINLLNEDFVRRDSIWFTDKDPVGATALKRLSSLGLHKTLNPYNAYKQGKLVNLPFTGSIYLDKE